MALPPQIPPAPMQEPMAAGPAVAWSVDVMAYEDGTYGLKFESGQEEMAEAPGMEVSEEPGAGEIKAGSVKEMLAMILDAAKNGGAPGSDEQEEEAFSQGFAGK